MIDRNIDYIEKIIKSAARRQNKKPSYSSTLTWSCYLPPISCFLNCAFIKPIKFHRKSTPSHIKFHVFHYSRQSASDSHWHSVICISENVALYEPSVGLQAYIPYVIFSAPSHIWKMRICLKFMPSSLHSMQ